MIKKRFIVCPCNDVAVISNIGLTLSGSSFRMNKRFVGWCNDTMSPNMLYIMLHKLVPKYMTNDNCKTIFEKTTHFNILTSKMYDT